MNIDHYLSTQQVRCLFCYTELRGMSCLWHFNDCRIDLMQNGDLSLARLLHTHCYKSTASIREGGPLMALTMQEAVASSKSRNAIYLSLAGYGLFLAWIWLCFSTSIVFPLAGSTPTIIAAPRLIAYLSDALTLLLLAYLCQRIASDILQENHTLAFTGSALGLASVGLLLLSVHFEGGPALAATILGWLFCGTTRAICTFAWIRLFCKIGHSDLCLCISGAIILGAAITYILCYLPLPVARTVAALLPAASFVLFYQAKEFPLFIGNLDVKESYAHRNRGIPSPTIRILVGIFVYALVFSALVNPLTTRNGIGIEADGGFMLLASFIAGAVIIVATRMASRIDKLRPVYLVVLPLMVITLVILPFVQNLPLNAAGFLGAFSFKLFDVICWVLIYDSALRNRIAPARALLSSRICYAWGLLFGTSCGFFMSHNGLFKDKDLFTTLCLGGVVILVIVTTIVLRESGLFPDSAKGDGDEEPISFPASEPEKPLPIPGPEDVFQYKTNQVAQRYGLTKREFEVFLLLSKGRSNKLIEERLVISPHTVDSHVTHIYRKCDVHSRQEVMDLIEEERVDMHALAEAIRDQHDKHLESDPSESLE